MASLLLPTGTTVDVQPAAGTAFRLPELQTIVGGYLEAVYLLDGRVMFVNGDGRRDGLAYNALATAVAAGVLRVGDFIVGNAIVCTMTEAGGGDAADP